MTIEQLGKSAVLVCINDLCTCVEENNQDCPADKLVKLRRLEHSIFLTKQKIADTFPFEKWKNKIWILKGNLNYFVILEADRKYSQSTFISISI